MTQANETNSRIARLEALTLEIAAANLRHDRAIEQQSERFDRIDERLDRIAQQQEANMHQIALNREDINTLTASIQELRKLVADYIQSRFQIEEG
jgi:archaellum component FlaC